MLRLQNSNPKNYIQNFSARKKKYFLACHFIENQVFMISALFPCFSLFKLMQLVCLVMEW